MASGIQGDEYAVLVPPQLIDNGAPAGITYTDMKDAYHATFILTLGTTDVATTAAPKVQECDTTDGTYNDVTGAALADAPAAGEDDTNFVINVDLRKLPSPKRYMKLLLTAGNGTTGTNMSVICIKKKNKGAENATDAGVTELVNV